MSISLCHTCGHHHGAGVAAHGAAERAPYMTMDLHCHLGIPEVDALVAAHPDRLAEASAWTRGLGEASVAHNLLMRAEIGQRLISTQQRLVDMERLGIDIQVLSPSPMQYHHWADETLAAEIAGLINAGILAATRSNPHQFLGLGYAPLQHPVLAVSVLEDLMARGLHGIEITSDPTGRGLDDPALEPVWAAADRLGAAIFLHPMGTSLGERVDRYYLSNIIGQPLETTIALSQLIYGGVLDRHPGLKICAAHGGGFLPFATGRFDHGHGVRPEARRPKHPPSDYLRRLWFDTVVFRPEAVRHLIDVAGATQVVAGTDYPYDMGEYALHGFIKGIPRLTPAEHEGILGANAIRFLGLESTHPALESARIRLGATS